MRREATWAICNACTEGNEEQLHLLIEEGVLFALVEMLASSDVQLLELVLDALVPILAVDAARQSATGYCTMLETLGGLQLLEKLQLHSNPTIYQKVVALLKAHYELEECSTPGIPVHMLVT